MPSTRSPGEARLDLAVYDANNSEQARCLVELLEQFPNNGARLLHRFGCLRDAPRDERIKFLEQVCAAKDADPVLFIELARTLQGDARCLAQAGRWLKRGLRFRPMEANAISVWAYHLWEEGRLEEATELYRFAANLESFREGCYQSWFVACRRTRRTYEAMAHLQDRFTRFGGRSEQPALTLAWAWREMEQPGRAREVLNEAARLRPEDGYLRLRSASLVAGLGDDAEADRLLNGAKGRVRENDWLRAAAEIAELGDGYTARFAAAANTSGLAGLTFTATDPLAATSFGPVTYKVLITTTNAPVSNTPPVLAAIINRTVIAGNVVTFTCTVSDTDTPPHTIRWTSDDRVLVSGADGARPKPVQAARMHVQRTGQLMYELTRLYPDISGVMPAYGWSLPLAHGIDGGLFVGPHRNFPHQLFAFGTEHDPARAFLASRILLRHVQGATANDDEHFGFARVL